MVASDIILGLLDAVRANPTDSTARLVYADALADTGDSDGERTQRLIAAALQAAVTDAPLSPLLEKITQLLDAWKLAAKVRLTTSVRIGPRSADGAAYWRINLKKHLSCYEVHRGRGEQSHPVGGTQAFVEVRPGRGLMWGSMTVHCHPDDYPLLCERMHAGKKSQAPG